MKLKVLLTLLLLSGCADYLPSLAPENGWNEVRCDVVPYSYDWRTKVYTRLEGESYTNQYRVKYSSDFDADETIEHRKKCENMAKVMKEKHGLPYIAITREDRHWDVFYDFGELTQGNYRRGY